MNAQIILSQLQQIYDADYKGFNQEQMNSFDTVHTIEGEGYKYEVTASSLLGMMKRFKTITGHEKNNTILPLGSGRGLDNRCRGLQQLYKELLEKPYDELLASRKYSNGITLDFINDILNKKAMKTKPKEQPKVVHLYVVPYSPKAIAVFGDTKQFKDKLKELGCKFNPFLKEGEVKKPGWIASVKHKAEIEQFVNAL